MKEIAIYVEGGGDTAQQRAELRNGFDQLLGIQKQAARTKRLKWKLVPSGSRNEAYRNFIHAVNQASEGTLCVLLVDSEEGILPELPIAADESPEASMQRELYNARVRRDHLERRDEWDLAEIPPQSIHLMVQCMETWIVASPAGMGAVYDHNFRPERLPVRRNLEEEPKASVYQKLADATKDTKMLAYSDENNSKIKHASRLLAHVRADQVAARCPRFATFIGWLGNQIQKA